MIVTEGGRFGGYGLFLSKGEFGFGRGKVVFLYNLLDLKRTAWEGPELAAGKHTIVFDFKSDGPGLGKGGTGVLSVDGKEVARKTMEHTHPDHVPGRRELRRRAGHPHRRGAARVSLRCAVQVHRQDRQADLRTRRGAVGSETVAARPRSASWERRAPTDDEEGARSRGRRRSRDRTGVADRPVAGRAVVAGRGTCWRRHSGCARGGHRFDRLWRSPAGRVRRLSAC